MDVFGHGRVQIRRGHDRCVVHPRSEVGDCPCLAAGLLEERSIGDVSLHDGPSVTERLASISCEGSDLLDADHEVAVVAQALENRAAYALTATGDDGAPCQESASRLPAVRLCQMT